METGFDLDAYRRRIGHTVSLAVDLGLTLTFRQGETSTSREISREALTSVLLTVFGIEVPPDCRFESLDGNLALEPKSPKQSEFSG